jgi:hypothetical protein
MIWNSLVDSKRRDSFSLHVRVQYLIFSGRRILYTIVLRHNVICTVQYFTVKHHVNRVFLHISIRNRIYNSNMTQGSTTIGISRKTLDFSEFAGHM